MDFRSESALGTELTVIDLSPNRSSDHPIRESSLVIVMTYMYMYELFSGDLGPVRQA